MAKSKKKITTYELRSHTFDPRNLELKSENIESKNPNEDKLDSHLTGGFTVTTNLIKQIIDVLKNG